MRSKIVPFLALILVCCSLSPSNGQEKTNVAAIVTSISGTLLVLPYGTSKWVTAEKGMFLYEGDQLKTEANSRAAITFANGIELVINENSTFTIRISEEKEIKDSIDLLIGEIFSRVMIKGVKFEVHTPVAVAAVRGTEFTTRVKKDKVTSILVYKGEVEVWNNLGRVTLTAGKRTVVTPNQAPQPPEEVDLEKEEKWQEGEKKGSLKMNLGSGEQMEGVPFELEIEALDKEGRRYLEFSEEVLVTATSPALEFSLDGGRSWKSLPAKVRVVGGLGKILLNSSRSEMVKISATSSDMDSGFIEVNIATAKRKNLIIQLEDKEGKKTLKLEFHR